MQCNIDSKGKAVRMISGIVVSAIGMILIFLYGLGLVTGTWPWVTSIALIALGGFQIFEARAGWCVVRAMGFKTRI